jgi:hypothetical protein
VLTFAVEMFGAADVDRYRSATLRPRATAGAPGGPNVIGASPPIRVMRTARSAA